MLASMFGNESVVRVLLNDRRVDFLLKDRVRDHILILFSEVVYFVIRTIRAQQSVPCTG